MSLEIPEWPASLWFVGLPRPPEAGPTLYNAPNRKASATGEFSWPDMTAAERGALRALCREVLSTLDRMETDGEDES